MGPRAAPSGLGRSPSPRGRDRGGRPRGRQTGREQRDEQRAKNLSGGGAPRVPPSVDFSSNFRQKKSRIPNCSHPPTQQSENCEKSVPRGRLWSFKRFLRTSGPHSERGRTRSGLGVALREGKLRRGSGAPRSEPPEMAALHARASSALQERLDWVRAQRPRG